METLLACYDLAPDHVVVEVHESLTASGHALELHVIACPDGIRTLPWWESEDGERLVEVQVGDA